VTFDPDLREQHYGVLQGQRYGDAPAVLAGHGLAEAWHRGEFSVRGRAVPGGESARKMRIRALRFVQRLDADYRPGDARNVLIVSHGGQLRVLLTVLLGLPARSRHHFAFSNCGVSRVARTHERTVLELLNAVYWTVTTRSVPTRNMIDCLSEASDVVVADEVGA
jgi:alpha-ribazole phosphatase